MKFDQCAMNVLRKDASDAFPPLGVIHTSAANRIDSAGFRYRSFWVSNTSYDEPRYHNLYRRYYPSDSTYLWWYWDPDFCEVTFWSDSLYVVGGSLSVDCTGALKEIPDIDSSFSVTTDTVIDDTARATKLIIVDQDPPNNMFYDSLGTDIIRAIAWVEWAGSNDTTHCHEPYSPRYNNYWDHVIVGQDTCYETKFPCENRLSTATGTMQMLRYNLWEPAFGRPDYFPPGYFQVSWDSLAWSWKINVFNGKFIYFIDNFVRMTPEQKTWPLVCELCDPADSVPLYPNKEDLSTYGYHEGAPAMQQVNSDNWLPVMKSEEDEGAKYVRKVRGSKYAREWED